MKESEVIERVEALPDRFADRLPAANVAGLREMAEGGEWAELVDELIASLRKRRPPVTLAERDELAALLAAMGLRADALSELNVQD